MREIIFTRKFLKDFKRHTKSEIPFKGRLNEVIELLGSGLLLEDKHKDHKLNGKWKGYRECHILFDLLLVYRYYDTHVELVTLDTHDAIF